MIPQELMDLKHHLLQLQALQLMEILHKHVHLKMEQEMLGAQQQHYQ